MKLSIGIVGLPNVGKSTLFKILTRQEVHIANYPFATIDPNVGVVPVPDERLDKLSAMSKSKKTVPAVVEFYDIAGLVKGANKGEGLGNQFLAHIRETQAIVVVIRLFGNSEIVHVEGTVDPVRDLEIINTELALKDLEIVEKRLPKAESEAKSGDKEAVRECEELLEIKKWLAEGNLVSSSELFTSLISAEGGQARLPASGGNRRIGELNLLTAKKQIYLLNGVMSSVSAEATADRQVSRVMGEKLLEKIHSLGADYLVMDLASADNISELIGKSYEILDLISFLTTGEDETRAWTIVKGMKAPEAAGVIHSDFEQKFIRAEVINWQKLLEVGSWAAARQKGMLRLEGKDYVVQDGDVMVIRHG